MNRFYKALFGTCLEVILLGLSILLFTTNKGIYLNILGYLLLVITSFIMLKINYEYFESPFYKNLNSIWKK